MTSEEIKQAMIEFAPVMYNGIEYSRISAYIYRVVETYKKGTYNTILQCELVDKCGHAVVIAEAAKVVRI